MHLFAYCLMDNHYHLVLRNSSGRMSDFFRNLNTHYAFYYRKDAGGSGYVFQGRFHSTIIADDAYLRMAILYVLRNPVRARLCNDVFRCSWTSTAISQETNATDWLDGEYVRELFGGSEGLIHALRSDVGDEFPVRPTVFGPVLGSDDFFKRALEKFDRRKKPDAVMKRRHNDFDFDPVDKVIWEFEKKHNVKVESLPVEHRAGKRLRAELLVRLRDLGGLNFREISELDSFAGLQYGSLRQIYLNARRIFYQK